MQKGVHLLNLAKESHHVSLCLAQHLSWTIAQCRGFHPREVLAFVVVYALDRSKEVRLDVLKRAFESVVEDLIDKKRWINFSRAVSPAFQFALKALEKYLKVSFHRALVYIWNSNILFFREMGKMSASKETHRDSRGWRPA